MRLDAIRGQLCEIAPSHNIRSPVTTTLLCCAFEVSFAFDKFTSFQTALLVKIIDNYTITSRKSCKKILPYFPCRFLLSFFSLIQSLLFFTDFPRGTLVLSLEEMRENQSQKNEKTIFICLGEYHFFTLSSVVKWNGDQ